MKKVEVGNAVLFLGDNRAIRKELPTEIDPAFYEIAYRRIETAQRQQPLFSLQAAEAGHTGSGNAGRR